MTNTETSGTKPVRVRFAPSPTGYIHLGNVRAALFNWMFARASEGTFVLRIEDTDLERHVEGSDRDICEVLSWLGLNWGEGPRVGGAYGPYYQTQRLETYQQIAQRLLDEGLAYYDFSQAPDREASPAEQSHEIVWESPDARLDPADLDRDVSQESIRVLGFDRMIETLGNSIKSSQQQLLAREAKLKYAEEEHRRISQLFERKAVPEAEKSEAELLEIESRAELRKDELTHLNYKIALALTQLFRQDQIETQAATQRDRKRAEIHSPVDGVVLEKMESNERVLPSGEVLLEIGQPEKMEVEAEILAQDAVTIQVGFPVEISGAAIGPE